MGAAITATWTGASGVNWSDGANWNFSSPPVTASHPNNDANDTFSVLIDGGAGGNSTANLDVTSTIDTLNVSTGDALIFNNTRDLTITGGSIVNNGAINMNGVTSLTTLTVTNSTTISGSGTLTLNDNNQNIVSVAAGTTLTNAATHTIQGGGNLLSNTGGLNNQGTIIANDLTPLTVDPGDASTNGGTMRADVGILSLSAATWANTGGTIEAINGGQVLLNNPLLTINGGTLSSATGGEIRSTVGTGATLDGVTLANGTVLRQLNTADLRIQGGIENNGTWNLDGATSSTVAQFLGTQTLSGTGEIVMNDSLQNFVEVDAGNVLTIGADQTIRGAGNLGGNSGGYIAHGDIIQQGTQRLTVDPGVADAGGGTNFIINGAFRATGSGGIQMLAGIYDNNTAIEATDGSFVDLASNAIEIQGGNLTTSGSGEIRATVGTGAILDAVTLTTGSNLVMNNFADLRIENGFVNDGTINMNGATSQTLLQFLGTQSLSGSGEIVMTDNAQNTIRTGLINDVLTIGSGQEIRGSGAIGANFGGYVLSATILQQGATTMTIDPGTGDAGGGANFVNNGTLRAEGPVGIRLQAGIFDNNTTIQANDGSFIDLFNNAVEIRGGNLTSIGSGEIRATTATGAILDAVTVTAGSTIVQNNTADLRIQNGMTLDGVWNVNGASSSTDINFLGSQTIDASVGETGLINLTDNIQNRIVTGGTDVVTIGSRIRVQGAGRILQNAGGMLLNGELIQQGTAAMTIDAGTADAGGGANFINNGVLRAEGAGGINLLGATLQNNATIEANAGSFINLGSNALELIGGNLTGEIRSSLTTGAILDSVTITAGSTIVQSNTADTRIRNGITLNGDWNVNGATSTTDINALNSQTIGGTGNISFTDSTTNRIITSSGETVTLGAGVTVSGAGAILSGVGGLINQGTINANGVTRLQLNAGTEGFSQQASLTASGAGGIDVQNGDRFTQAAGITDIQSGSRLDVIFSHYVQTGGITTVNGILTTASSNSNVELQGGRLEGTGTIDFNGTGSHALNNTGGTLAAGNSPGILTITDGDYIQATTASFEYELSNMNFSAQSRVSGTIFSAS